MWDQSAQFFFSCHEATEPDLREGHLCKLFLRRIQLPRRFDLISTEQTGAWNTECIETMRVNAKLRHWASLYDVKDVLCTRMLQRSGTAFFSLRSWSLRQIGKRRNDVLLQWPGLIVYTKTIVNIANHLFFKGWAIVMVLSTNSVDFV